MSCVTNWHQSPLKGEARHAPGLPAFIKRCWTPGQKRHPEALYPPGPAIRLAAAGQDLCVVTPTASGKTLCYNVPILNAILDNPDTRALYLFPTKAPSQDQVSALYELITAMDVDIKTYTYDGDTPLPPARPSARRGMWW